MPLCDPPDLTAEIDRLEALVVDLAEANAGLEEEVSQAETLLTACNGNLAECRSRPFGLPDTGQTLCYDEDGNEIACDTAECPGQDGLYATGCAVEGRFVGNGDGTVTDTCTGLMWLQDGADANGDGEFR